ncbi:MAG: prolipoprotein diacylglyceryl transferase [Oscillospiraceae bacterium]|nr:prolipoprotein diacylglyceryl transferase [Oscillospiraceae bacterium]
MHQITTGIGISAPTYWLMAFFGLIGMIILALWRRRVPRFQTSVLDIVYTILCSIAGGLIGAKAFQLIGYAINYGHLDGFWTLENWISMLPGVGVLYGGLLGGVLAAIIYIRINKLSFSEVSDILVPPLLLFFTFGRIGCFSAGCCHGIAAEGFFTISDVVPVQLYEATFTFIFMLVLFVWRPERKLRGILLPIYLISYAVARFLLEFLRGDAGRGIVLGLSTSQWISLLVLPAGIIYLLWVKKQNSKEEITHETN